MPYARNISPRLRNGREPGYDSSAGGKRHRVGIAGTLYGEITLKNGRVQQGNFHDYRVLRMSEAPTIETYIVQGSEHPGGMGETGTSAIAPAITNAIYAATGTRLRKLPVADQLKHS